jgi:hypothetical protein
VIRYQYVCVGLLLSAISAVDLAMADPPVVGERFPDFVLANIADGRPVALSNFRGKKVLLIQFASW